MKGIDAIHDQPDSGSPARRVGDPAALQQMCFDQLRQATRYKPAAVSRLWQVTEASKRYTALSEFITEMARVAPASRNTLMLQLRYGADCHAAAAARAAYAALLAGADNTHDIAVLFEAAVKIHDEPELQAALSHLLYLAERRRDAGGDDARPAALLCTRLLLALGVYGQARQALQRSGTAPGVPLLAHIATMLERRASAAYPDYQAPKVFCLGLSKTGTSSVADALQMLGYRCAHWVNPVTLKLLSLEDFLLFDAFSDIGISYRFEQLHDLFPNALFVCTERAFPDWERSFLRHFAFFGDSYAEIRASAARSPRKKYGREWEAMHQSLYFDHGDLATAHAAFATRVQRFFADKPGRLLRLDVFNGGGWNQLCDFLGRPVPTVPFPHSNRTLQAPQ